MLYHFNLYPGDLNCDLWKSDLHFRLVILNYLSLRSVKFGSSDQISWPLPKHDCLIKV